jgi:hypothetical protein
MSARLALWAETKRTRIDRMLDPCSAARIGRHFPPKHSSCLGGVIALGLNAQHIHPSVALEVGRRISGHAADTDCGSTTGIACADNVLYPHSGARVASMLAGIPEPDGRESIAIGAHCVDRPFA